MTLSACSHEENLNTAIGQMQFAKKRQGGIESHLLPTILSMRLRVRAPVQQTIIRRFEAGNDGTVFGLTSAVTSVARDTVDPKSRWRLEELGGGILAGLTPVLPPHDGVAEACAAAAE